MLSRFKQLPPHKQQVILLVIWGLGIAILLGNFFGDPIKDAYLVAESTHFSHRQTVVSENREKSGILIVGVGQNTTSNPMVQQLFGKWPYKRDFFGYMVRFLNRAHPDFVILDIAFQLGSDQENPEKDQMLADAIEASPYDVIAALMFREGSLTEETREFAFKHQVQLNVANSKRFRLARTANRDINLPFKALELAGARFAAAANLHGDVNKVVRDTFPFVYLFDEETRDTYAIPTIPLSPLIGESQSVLWDGRDHIQIGEKRIDLHGETEPIIKWYGNVRMFDKYPALAREEMKVAHIYPRVEAWNLVYSELLLECTENPALPICKEFKRDPRIKTVSPQSLRGKKVLIGVTMENQDVHPSIYGTDYPGVYMQANILDNYLSNDFVIRAPFVLNYIICFGMFVLALGLCSNDKLWFGTLVPVVGIVYTWFTYYAYSDFNWWLEWTLPMICLVGTMTIVYLQRFINAENKKQQLRFAFKKYVSEGTMQSIEKDPENPNLQGGQRRKLTFLFCDIRGFTRFSENQEPEYVQQVLTQYFSVMNTIILQEYSGSINKLLGDAIMAYWGFPLTNQDQEYLTVSAALAMKRAVQKWQDDPATPHITVGIGINTGNAIIGNVGSKDFMDFTVIGDSVNIASRLEQLNKEYDTTIILSSVTHEAVKDRVECREIGTIKVRGREKETTIFEAMRLKDSHEEQRIADVIDTLYATAVGEQQTSAAAEADAETAAEHLPPEGVPDRRK